MKIITMPEINAFWGKLRLKLGFLLAGFFLGVLAGFFLGVVLRTPGFLLDPLLPGVDLVRAVTFFFVLVVFGFEPVVEVVFFFVMTIPSSNVPVHYSIEVAGWQGGNVAR